MTPPAVRYWSDLVSRAAWANLGKCTPSGQLLPEVLEENRRRRGGWISETFSETDGDFVDYLGGAAPEDIDDFATSICSTADMVEEGVRSYPMTFSALGQLRPEMVNEGLQLAAVNALTGSNKSALETFLLWRNRNPGTLPQSLKFVRLVADGLSHGRDEVKKADLGRRAEPQPDEPVVALMSDLAAIALDNDWAHEPLQKARRRRLRANIAGHPDSWLDLLPWVLQLTDRNATYLEAVSWTLDAGADPFARLGHIAEGSVLPAAQRAAGVLETFEGDGLSTALISRVAREYDMNLGDAFPQPLAAPTSTWVSSHDIEQRLRNAVKQARTAWSHHFIAQGSAEEEGHVAFLLARLEETLATANDLHAKQNGRRPVELTGEYRRVNKYEEGKIQADLAILIRIDVHGEIRTQYGELIQVKKTEYIDRPDNPIQIGKPNADQWSIEIDQLRTLLNVSPTAVYWLLAHDGYVLVVPGKVVLGIVEAKIAHEGQQHVTVHYTQVRHAAIDLENYLVDLTIGGWLGSTSDVMVELATGTSAPPGARTPRTSAYPLFEIVIKRSAE